MSLRRCTQASPSGEMRLLSESTFDYTLKKGELFQGHQIFAIGAKGNCRCFLPCRGESVTRVVLPPPWLPKVCLAEPIGVATRDRLPRRRERELSSCYNAAARC